MDEDVMLVVAVVAEVVLVEVAVVMAVEVEVLGEVVVGEGMVVVR